MLNPSDALKLIETFLSPRWFFASSSEDKDEIHRLADELRKASGLLPDNPEEEQKPYLCFPVISDIHVQYWDTDAHNKFAAALIDLNEINPACDALIINGDLGDGRPSDYQVLSNLLATASHPQHIYYTIGNHEFYKAYYDQNGNWNPNTFPNLETDRMSIERFLSFAKLPSLYYDTWMKGHHFIFLGSEQYKQSDPTMNEDAYLSEAQLTWLKTTLNQNYIRDKAIFVFLHQPLPGTVSGSNNRGVVQFEALRVLLSQYPEVILFTGHTHWELRLSNTLVRNTFTMVNSSSVHKPYDANDLPLAGNKSEGLFIEVYADRIVIKGRDFAGKRWIPEAQFTIAFN